VFDKDGNAYCEKSKKKYHMDNGIVKEIGE
jgi:hypothetical protein